MATLRELKESGYVAILYCLSKRTMCSHSWPASWDQLIQYLGPDYDMNDRRVFARRFVCEVCGGRGAKVHVLPAPGYMSGMKSHNHSRPSDEVMAGFRKESEAVEARLAAQLADYAMHRRQGRERDKARKAIESGKDLIGPPSPYQGRQRPNMKG